MPGQLNKRLFSLGRFNRCMNFIHPTYRLGAERLDLPCHLVADRPTSLHLAEHRRRHLNLGREGLLNALGQRPARYRCFGELVQQHQQIGAAHHRGVDLGAQVSKSNSHKNFFARC